jgi:hypothetical protein
MSRHNRTAARLVGVLVASSLIGVAAVAGPVTSANAGTRVVRASLNFATPSAGHTISTLAVGGSYSTALTASVVTANAGRAVSAVSNPGYNNAADLPSYVPLGNNPPIAVVRLRDKSSSVDPLGMGYGNFTWQADFSLDDNLGSDPVDGDNLVQRGLSPQKQWKLSIDRHKAQCFVRTAAYATAAVTPEITIPKQTSNVRWYRAICNRSLSGVLTIKVYAYSNSAGGWLYVGGSTAGESASGSLTFPWSVPVSIGGKLTDTGAIAMSPSPDQFNGKIDNVVLAIGP